MSKQLPRPKITVIVEPITVDNEAQGQILVDILNKHEIQARVRFETQYNCFGCEYFKGVVCDFRLRYDECPTGGLFNNNTDKYNQIIEQLQLKGFDITWLTSVYEKIMKKIKW